MEFRRGLPVSVPVSRRAVVTNAVIKRLAGQIDALEQQYHAKPFKVIFVTCADDESSEAAVARHKAEHPEDAEADVAIITTFVSPDDFQRAKALCDRKAAALRAQRREIM